MLFNTWKHHAAALRLRIGETVAAGAPALKELAARLVVIGTELMDLYLGRLTPAEIGVRIIQALQTEGRLELSAFRDWVREAGGYRLITFPEDGSRWCLRLGDEAGRYVHAHPARWAPQTCRVRANVLKTAVLVLADAGIRGGDPLDRKRVNEVRRDYLRLAPLGKDLKGDQGLGGLIELLKG